MPAGRPDGAWARSAEDAVKEPALSRRALAEDPEADTGAAERDVIVAADVVTIPPAGLDALGPGDERAGPAVERLRLGEHPQRARRAHRGPEHRQIREVPRLGDPEGALGAVLGHRQHAEHGVVTEPRTQEVEEARGRLRVRAAAALEEPRVAELERRQHAGAQPERDDGLREAAAHEPLVEQLAKRLGIPRHAREREGEPRGRMPAMQEVDAQRMDAGSARAQESLEPGEQALERRLQHGHGLDRKSTRLNSSHLGISYAVFCLKKKRIKTRKA